jgi:HEAT repeat protein
VKRAALVLCGLLAAGCGERAAAPAPPAPPELAPVVARALAAAPVAAPLPTWPVEREAEVDGLLEFCANASGDLARVGREDVLRLGPGVLPLLATRADDATRPVGVRAAALAALGEAEDAAAGPLLAGLLARGTEPWVRSSAAWYLGERADDAWVPDAVLVLKYEVDASCVRFLAQALAKRGCLAGVPALLVLAPTDPESAALAEGLAREHGHASAVELERARLAGRLPAPATSAAFDAAVWRFVARLAEYQLRGVDDARYVLAQLGEVAADELAAALSDENRYVRLHACQCLERMGRRGAAAAAELERHLASPDIGPSAAVALGAVGGANARAALEASLAESRPFELRLGAARGLARLGDPSAGPFLASAFDRSGATATELAQALAEAWCASTGDLAAARHVAAYLTATTLEPTSSGRVLEDLLARGAAEDRPGFADLHAQWLAIGARRSATFDEAAMWRARRELLEAHPDFGP